MVLLPLRSPTRKLLNHHCLCTLFNKNQRRPVIEGLGLPYLHPDEAYALMVAGTGTYCFNGSNEILTGAR